MVVRKHSERIFTPKKTFGLVFLFLAIRNSFVIGQFYYLEKEHNSPGKYRKTGHSVTPASGSDKALAIGMMDAKVDAVKKIYPQPIEADVGSYGGIRQKYRGVGSALRGSGQVVNKLPLNEWL